MSAKGKREGTVSERMSGGGGKKRRGKGSGLMKVRGQRKRHVAGDRCRLNFDTHKEGGQAPMTGT